MSSPLRRGHAVERGVLRSLVVELHDELAIFAASTDREHFHEPFDQILAIFDDEVLDMFELAMAAYRGGPLEALNVPDMRRLITAFRDDNTHQRDT